MGYRGRHAQQSRRLGHSPRAASDRSMALRQARCTDRRTNKRTRATSPQPRAIAINSSAPYGETPKKANLRTVGETTHSSVEPISRDPRPLDVMYPRDRTPYRLLGFLVTMGSPATHRSKSGSIYFLASATSASLSSGNVMAARALTTKNEIQSKRALPLRFTSVTEFTKCQRHHTRMGVFVNRATLQSLPSDGHQSPNPDRSKWHDGSVP